MSPDNVTGYPRWQGELSGAPRFITVAWHELRRGYNDQWGRALLLVAAGYAILSIASLSVAAKNSPSVHSMDNFVTFLKLLLWGSLGVASVMAGPALLEDQQRGALELYMSRSLTRRDWLLGKTLAVVGLSFAMVFVPAVLYVLGAAIVIDKHPANWGWAWAGALGYAAIWSLVISGIGLGLSCVMRSARAASLVLLGGVAGLDIILGSLLSAISRNTQPEVLSPLSALQNQVVWLFPGAKAPYDFPFWWGLITLAGLAIIGWALVWWRAPRLKGVE